ncbi:hypothetical protein GUITHDRAFT_153064 [Guillardia theta CCMP2712]|uniref:Uncharacterized protein n=2 Tax=Guillardia theta TaxID=55529 RepID=L1J6Z3_GUITC|nr:hypothetical protein GUITHDRAFT_153064 [Guillardia theta CCMP2712]EKX44122.1 hypothetical protein GUITHDRAFT_153064 [Guillardia theta CCMP2712]|eukprot:XP_005831102.1 hypothetical protein GUITHDRAFT_153064 [Guillardia theta CCMP2712]
MEETMQASGGDSRQKDKRAVISEEIAVEIFAKRKISFSSKQKSAHSSLVAAQHGVSPKSVRDVWDRRTWVKATMPLWTPAEVEQYEKSNKRPPGRPLGRTDSKPRKPRSRAQTDIKKNVNEVLASVSSKNKLKTKKGSSSSSPLDLASSSSSPSTTFSMGSEDSNCSISKDGCSQPSQQHDTRENSSVSPPNLSSFQMLVCKSLEALTQAQTQVHNTCYPLPTHANKRSNPCVDEQTRPGWEEPNAQIKPAIKIEGLRPLMTRMPATSLLPTSLQGGLAGGPCATALWQQAARIRLESLAASNSLLMLRHRLNSFEQIMKGREGGQLGPTQ